MVHHCSSFSKWFGNFCIFKGIIKDNFLFILGKEMLIIPPPCLGSRYTTVRFFPNFLGSGGVNIDSITIEKVLTFNCFQIRSHQIKLFGSDIYRYLSVFYMNSILLEYLHTESNTIYTLNILGCRFYNSRVLILSTDESHNPTL